MSEEMSRGERRERPEEEMSEVSRGVARLFKMRGRQGGLRGEQGGLTGTQNGGSP